MFSRKKSDKKKASSSSHRNHHRSHRNGHRSDHHDEPEDPIEEHADEPDDDGDRDEDEDEDKDEDATEEPSTSGLQNPNLLLSYTQTSSSSNPPMSYTVNPSSSFNVQTSTPSSSREPDYYYDIGIPPTLGNLRVKGFRVVSHTTGTILGGPDSASHWSIYLIHDSGSVRLSMGTDKRRDIPYPRGRLAIYTYDYTSASNSAVRFWEFPAIRDDLTVKDVYLAIGNHRRHLYDMGENGRGCRFWVQYFMIDMEMEGYITGYTRDIDYTKQVKIEDIIEYRYSRGLERISFPMIEGTFL